MSAFDIIAWKSSATLTEIECAIDELEAIAEFMSGLLTDPPDLPTRCAPVSGESDARKKCKALCYFIALLEYLECLTRPPAEWDQCSEDLNERKDNCCDSCDSVS